MHFLSVVHGSHGIGLSQLRRRTGTSPATHKIGGSRRGANAGEMVATVYRIKGFRSQVSGLKLSKLEILNLEP